jgi:thiamine pyrophosphokinase
MRALLVGPLIKNSFPLFLKTFSPKKDFLIAIDGGLDALSERDITPDFVVGDLDSIQKSKKKLKDLKVLKLPEKKDRSDLFFAVLSAMNQGADRILCFGITGGYPDYDLANLYDLGNFAAGNYGLLKSVEVMSSLAHFFFLSEKIPVLKKKVPLGTKVSLFALSHSVKNLSITGFLYPMVNQTLGCSSLGLSNEVIKNSIRVELSKGKLVVMLRTAYGAPGRLLF